jgi:hypothetical protein
MWALSKSPRRRSASVRSETDAAPAVRRGSGSLARMRPTTKGLMGWSPPVFGHGGDPYGSALDLGLLVSRRELGQQLRSKVAGRRIVSGDGGCIANDGGRQCRKVPRCGEKGLCSGAADSVGCGGDLGEAFEEVGRAEMEKVPKSGPKPSALEARSSCGLKEDAGGRDTGVSLSPVDPLSRQRQLSS